MKCPNCDSPDVELFYVVNHSPCLQNILYPDEEVARQAKTIEKTEFYKCNGCIYLFNPGFEPDNVTYDGSYDNDQSESEAYRQHIQTVLEQIDADIDGLSGKRVLEIGCGNGYLLSLMGAKGAEVTGYDPAYQGKFGQGDVIKKEYWSPSDNEQWDLIVMRLTVEGLLRVDRLFDDIKQACHQNTYLYLELIDLGNVLRNAEAVNLYHECARYHSANSITHYLSRFQFELKRISHYDGGWLGVMSQHLGDVGAMPTLNKGVLKGEVAIWGISGRSIQFLTHNDLGVEDIHYAVDIDANKQGKFIPYTGHEIIGPEPVVQKKPDQVIVLNGAYIDEARNYFSYNVQILSHDDLFSD